MASDPTISRLAGSLLMVGFDGIELPNALDRALRDGGRAGVVLFRRNLPDLETMSKITARVHATVPADLPPIIAIDQEGGRVTRLPAPALSLPSMRRLSQAGAPSLAERAGRIVGIDLRALGVNLDFAPVLDVDSNPENPIIGDRAFSSDAALVSAYALAFARGLNRGGVLACGKHFPGHGDTDTDSHLALPTIRHDRARLDAIELVPFREAARAGLDSLMSAHLVVTSIDPDVPATLSSAVCTDLLRHEIGYAGVLFSDDLEMRAVSDAREVEDNAVMAIAAGCDALLVCKSEELADRAHVALVREAEKSEAFRARCAEASRRMETLRRRAAELSATPAPSDTRGLWNEVLTALEKSTP